MKKLMPLILLASGLALQGCGDSEDPPILSQFNFRTALEKSLANGQGGADEGNITTTADFESNGSADFAVVNRNTDSLSLFRANGEDFAAEQLLPTIVAPRAVFAADPNGDGRPDLLVISATQLGIHFNDGAGNFGAAQTVNVGTDNLSLVAADFDGDSRQDIAIADNGAQDLHVLFGDASATPANYEQQHRTATADNVRRPVQIVAADIDRDGSVDLTFANAESSTLTLWLNGNGTRRARFDPGATFVTGLGLPNGTTARGLAAADLNGDSRPDLVYSAVNGSGQGVVGIILNTSAALSTLATYPVGNDPQGLRVADFNADSVADVAVVSRTGTGGTGQVDILLGNPDGVFSAARAFPVVTGKRLSALSVGDFNRDGLWDIVTAGPGSAFVLLNSTTASTEE